MPVLGSGNNPVQPLGVDEVADLFVRALTMPQAVGKIYQLGGPRPMTFNEFLDTLSRVVCRRRRAKVHIPLLVARPLVGLLDRLLSRAPVTRE